MFGPLPLPVGFLGGINWGYTIANSAQPNGTNGYLTLTPTAGNRKLLHFSGWVKRAKLGADQGIFTARQDNNNFSDLYFDSSDRLVYITYVANVAVGQLVTTRVFRDVGALYFIEFFLDTDNGTAANRQGLRVNGEAITAFDTNTQHGSGDQPWFLSNNPHTIFARNPSGSATQFGDYYGAEIRLIEGATPASSAFGSGSPQAWTPKAYAGSYGTRGFHLDFSNGGSLGLDASGNGNNWTVNGTITQSNDSPTDARDGSYGNFATWNPLVPGAGTFSNGNRDYLQSSTTARRVGSTLALPSTGKFYWEATVSSTSNGWGFGLLEPGQVGQTGLPGNANGFAGFHRTTATNIYNFLMTTIAGSITVNVNDEVQGAVDLDAQKLWFGVNGTWYDSGGGTTGDPATGANATISGIDFTGYFPGVVSQNSIAAPTVNFGATSFAQTPPTGFKRLCTANLPKTRDLLSSMFAALPYTGDGVAIGSGGKNVTGADFTPNFGWIKSRSVGRNHALFDSLRGATKRLRSDTTDAEDTLAETLAAFISGGFTVGNNVNVNNNAETYIAWLLSLPTTEVVTTGTISVTWIYNATLGIAIGIYTGTGSNATLGIPTAMGALGAPFMTAVKNRSQVTHWYSWHEGLPDGSYRLLLSSTNAQAVDATAWNSTAPTSSVIHLGSTQATNGSGDSMMVMAFFKTPFCRPVQYEGTASTDGAFYHANGHPAFFMTKNIDSGGNWTVKDTERSPRNVANKTLWANLANAEATASHEVDIVATGVKMRNTGGDTNASGTYCGVALTHPNPYGAAQLRAN